MAPEKKLYRVRDAMVILSLGRSTIYEQMRSGRLRSVTEGRSRLIPRPRSLSTSSSWKAKQRPPDGRAPEPGRRWPVLG